MDRSCLNSCPLDVLHRIVNWLPTDALLSLRACGNSRLSKRIEQEIHLTELFVRQACNVNSALCTVGERLTRLVIHIPLRPGAVKHGSLPMAHRWAPSLPKTLVEIDFWFTESCTMWLRRVQPGEVHWALCSSHYGYAPIYMDQLVPNLKVLKLRNTNLDRAYCVHRIPLRSFPNARSDLEYPVTGSEYDGTRPGNIYWTEDMFSLFVRKLPRDLVTFEQDLPCEISYILPHLPPRLLSFKVAPSGPIRGNDPNRASQDSLPESLFSTLTQFDYILEGPIIGDTLSRFSQLESINFEFAPLTGEQLSLLPSTLSSLTVMCCKKIPNNQPAEEPEVLIQPEDFVNFPRHLTSLRILSCPCPAKSPQFDFAPSLPRDLTHLAIQAHYQQSQNLEAAHFRSLDACLLHLRSLEVVLNYVHWGELSWVPVDRLFSLSLGGNAGVRPTDISSWRSHTLQSLAFNGKTGNHLPPSIASKLPQSLTELSIATTHFGSNWKSVRDFVRHLPESVSILRLDYYNGMQHNFRYNLPPGIKTLSTAELQRRWENPFGESSIVAPLLTVPNLVPMNDKKCLLPEAFKLRPSITTVDLPVLVDVDSPLWNLPSLTSLSVLRFAYDTIHDKSTTFPNLKSMAASAFIDELWLLSDLFKRINSLSLPIETDTFDFIPLKKLKNLTHLGLTITSTTLLRHNSDAPMRKLFDSIPRTVTSLETSHTLSTGAFEEWLEKRMSKGAILESLTIYAHSGDQATVKDAQLRVMHPHLKTLTVARVLVREPLGLYASLPRDCAEMTDWALATALCPSITKLNGMDEKGWKRYSAIPISWNIDCGPIDEMASEIDDSAKKSNKTILDDLRRSHSLPSRLINWDYWSATSSLGSTTVGQRMALAQELPPALTRLSWKLNFFESLMTLLPSSLTWLDLAVPIGVKNLPAKGDELSPFPTTLTVLRLLFGSERATIPKAFMSILPPNLKHFTTDITAISTPDILRLPTTLTTLVAANLLLGDQVAVMPASLTKLVIKGLHLTHIMPELPANLKILSLQSCMFHHYKQFAEDPKALVTLHYGHFQQARDMYLPFEDERLALVQGLVNNA